MDDWKKVCDKLDAVIKLLETLIIFETLRAEMGGGRVRHLLGVDMNRVTRVSKALKSIKKRGA